MVSGVVFIVTSRIKSACAVPAVRTNRVPSTAADVNRGLVFMISLPLKASGTRKHPRAISNRSACWIRELQDGRDAGPWTEAQRRREDILAARNDPQAVTPDPLKRLALLLRLSSASAIGTLIVDELEFVNVNVW